ncbi:threonine-phosphate decarboxylase CobD [Rhizobium sp. AAP43]|uniref:threonine-phosphate decarboxylase CobD n=1 Tax=Rhizobium sp. AAP43 TaxID=1523420 RepID=UPI0006B95B1C|nr:threonine-phosphate decarboxylase CobD [Rhizobium sp. AAP43]KPF44113.1 threonine-phosphate decarboxylase [Rhizobium sp. AAP43]
MNGRITHGGGIAAAVAIHGGRIEDWLDLSTGINPCPPALPDIPARAWHRLPDQELELAAREAAQRYYGSGDRLPLPVPGTQSVIQLLPRLVPAGGRVAILSPTYGEYRRVFELAGFTVDAMSDLDEVTERHALVVVVNPNNPDGRTFHPQQLAPLIEQLGRQGGYLVVDEAFGDATPEITIAATDEPHVIVFRSFGKFFGLAGIRLGFVIAGKPIAERMADWLGPWAVSGPALTLATHLLSSDVEPIHARIAERWNGLYQVLNRAGLEIAGAAGLLTLVQHERAAELHEHLCRHHILTRRFDYRSDWLRFGLAPDTAGDARLAEALDRFSR